MKTLSDLELYIDLIVQRLDVKGKFWGKGVAVADQNKLFPCKILEFEVAHERDPAGPWRETRLE